MADYNALKAAISAAPYSTMTDAQILSALNTASIAVPVYVPIQAIATYLGEVGKLNSFLAWADAPPSGTISTAITAAQELAFAIREPQTIAGFDMTNATVAAGMESFLAALVTPATGVTGPIAAADQSAILGLASTLQTPAVATYGFGGPITEADLAAARNLP
jgi:hypothetical protein